MTILLLNMFILYLHVFRQSSSQWNFEDGSPSSAVLHQLTRHAHPVLPPSCVAEDSRSGERFQVGLDRGSRADSRLTYLSLLITGFHGIVLICFAFMLGALFNLHLFITGLEGNPSEVENYENEALRTSVFYVHIAITIYVYKDAISCI